MDANEVNRVRRKCLWVSILILSAVLTATADIRLAFFLGFFAQFHSSGVSFWKAYLFFAWTAVVLLITATGRARSLRTLSRLLVLSIATGSAFSLLLHKLYTSAAGLSPFEFSLAVDRAFQSSNHLVHVHVAKVALFPIVHALGVSGRISADFGEPFVRFLPADVPILAALFLVFCCAVFFWDTVAFSEKRVRNGASFPEILVYVLSAFSVLKGIFDGGPISAAFLAGLVVVVSLRFAPDRVGRILIPVSGILAPATALWLLTMPDSPLRVWLTEGLGIVLFLPAFVPTATFGRRILAVASRAALIPIAALGFWIGDAVYAARTTVAPERAWIEENGPVAARVAARYDGHLIPSVQVPAGTSVLSLYHAMNLSPSRKNVQIEGLTCEIAKPLMQTGRLLGVLGRPTPGRFIRDPLIHEARLVVCPSENRCSFRFLISFSECASNRFGRAVVTALHACDLESFVIATDLPEAFVD
jgi:hypothetical protein